MAAFPAAHPIYVEALTKVGFTFLSPKGMMLAPKGMSSKKAKSLAHKVFMATSVVGEGPAPYHCTCCPSYHVVGFKPLTEEKITQLLK